MTPGDAAKSQVRPALATAGGLLVAVTVLEIAQQVISVFSPRTSIQVALILAVGLAAFTAERLRSGRPLRDPVTLTTGLGCIAALGVAAAVWLASGFSTPSKALVGEQVDDVRAALRRDGFEVTYRRMRLHQAAESHLFVLKPRPGGTRSDEVRLYDAVDGELQLALRFRPDVTFPEAPDQPASASFRLSTVVDVDGDGQKEILASYDTNQAGTEFQRVPIMISRRGRYVVTPLLAVRSLGPAASAGLPTYGFGPAGRRGAPSVWVSELALDRGRLFLAGRVTLATSVVTPEGDPKRLSLTVEPAARNGGRTAGIPRHVRLWSLDVGGARPAATPLCFLGAPAAVRVRARELETDAFLGRSLAEAIRTAHAGVGEFIDGLCGDAGS